MNNNPPPAPKGRSLIDEIREYQDQIDNYWGRINKLTNKENKIRANKLNEIFPFLQLNEKNPGNNGI